VNTKSVNSAAGVILAALTQNRTAAGIALALDSARMLMTPEIAAELEQIRVRVGELEAQREALVERLRAGQQWKRGRNPELVSQNFVSQSELRSIFGIPLAAPWDDAEASADEVTRLLAPVQALREEQYESLHHSYRVGRDLPEMGGAL
jgi:hypothetical protein